MRDNTLKFRVGNRVKILPLATSVGVESEDVGKIGVISRIYDKVSPTYGILVQMNEVCKVRGYIPEWSVGRAIIEITPVKNEQLLFDFME